ncbi:MAG: GTP-binding protein, partial [Coriobacteriales bacterium]
MDKIEFLVVSGFLGAGKTTTMIALAEYMDAHMQKVGIIANDLGAQLVDTNLTRESGCTVEEIASGCICYQMENTVDRIRRMRDGAGAKLVMSDIPGCGVGTVEHVYKQILRDNPDEFWLGPLTVIVDPERLRMIMPEQADINLPPELKYLLETQVEEADLVVLNKIDKLSEAELERYLAFLEEVCQVPVLAISAREGTGIPQLAEYLVAHGSALREVEIDYAGPDYS